MDFLAFLDENNITYKENVNLRDITKMNQCGVLPLVLYPNSQSQLALLYRVIIKNNYTYDILGGLTNTYLCNNYSRDVIILTTKVRDFVKNDNTVTVGCGYNLTKLSKELSNDGITNFEGFIGIPGTVGAAAINNSGAYHSSMSNVVLGVNVINSNGELIFFNRNDLKYTTRNSILKHKYEKYVLISVVFDISCHDDANKIKERIQVNTQNRKRLIDGKRKSLGSVFVSTTLKELTRNNSKKFFFKKICNLPLKYFFKSKRINTYMDFLFLGYPSLAKHCDSLNRFCWDKETKEKDFFKYIDIMQRLSNNKLNLEIQIKK